MAKRSEWDFAVKAVETGNEYADVIPGRVAKPRERIPGHDETSCAACGGIVKISNFICPHCNGKVRTPARPEKRKAENGSGIALWATVGLLAVIALMLAIFFGYTNLIDDRFSVVDKNAIRVGMKRAEVEAKLGKPTTVILSMGNSDAVAWVRGEGEDLSSIAVTFGDGVVIEVAGSNLK